MGEIVSAGSYVAAVMEMAGYGMQADILDEFQSFFREAGAFIYTIAGVGAVVSMVTFGSFRAMRYLLIGPAIFWVLVSQRYTFDGVQWQVGAGVPRGLHRQVGAGKSIADVRRAVQELGYKVSNIQVAYGFALFVRPINGIVREINGILLRDSDGRQREDDEYRTFLHRGRAYDAITNARIRSPFLLRVIDENLKEGCIDYTGYAMALGSPELSDDFLATLRGPNGNPQALEVAERRKAEYLRRYNEMGQTSTSTNLPTQQLLQVTGNITCRVLWEKTAEFLWQGDPPPPPDFVGPPAPGRNLGEAGRELKRIMGMTTFDGADAATACTRLVEKFLPSAPTNGTCEQKLKAVIALFMIKNTFMDRQALVRFSMSLHNQTATQNPRMGRTMINPAAPNSAVTGMGDSAIETIEAIRPVMVGPRPLGGVYNLDPSTGNIQQQASSARRWSSGHRLTVFGGANIATQASFVDFPRYQTRKLVQQIFSWSLNAPWWQGVMLYLLAVAYPFLALVVLIPGRAASMLNLPLAWLWIKGWDIGFAMVLVLERTLWNNNPSMNIPENRAVPPQSLQLWQIFEQAQKVDPIWTIHGYYMVVAAALLAVPVLTGAVTLRSKRAILSSFTEKLMQDVKQSGDLGAAQVQIQAAAGRSQLMYELQNQAIRSMRQPGRDDALRQMSATTYGLIAGFQSLSQGLNSGMTGWQAWNRGLRAANTAREAALQAQTALEDADRAAAVQHHPLYGRLGLYGKAYDAEKAGADASGGFEMEGTSGGTDRSIEAFIDGMKFRLNFMSTVPFQGTPTMNAALSMWGIQRLFSSGFLGSTVDDPIGENIANIRMIEDELRRRQSMDFFATELARLTDRNRDERTMTVPALIVRMRGVEDQIHALNSTDARRNAAPGSDDLKAWREEMAARQADLLRIRSVVQYRLAQDGEALRVDPQRRDGRPVIDRTTGLPAPIMRNGSFPQESTYRPALTGAIANQYPGRLDRIPAADLNRALEDLRGRQEGLYRAHRDNMQGEFTRLLNSPPIRFMTDQMSPNMVGQMVATQVDQFIAFRGWDKNNLSPGQRVEVEAFEARLRRELTHPDEKVSRDTALLGITFGITPQNIQRAIEDRGTGRFNYNSSNYADQIAPYTPDNADSYRVPAFVVPSRVPPRYGNDSPYRGIMVPPSFPRVGQHDETSFPVLFDYSPPGYRRR